MRHLGLSLGILLLALASPLAWARAETWRADNGDGTFTNPLFYDEFSDPDLIRVGEDYYLTGTTMHSMPGLPILHSKDLVNWRLLGYASDRLDLGPRFRLEGGKNVYGQGIWAPSFRHHKGVFYIFSNVNGETTQVFRATDPAGPWTRTPMKRSLHDLSVLFDDDGKVYAIWGYQGIHLAELNAELTDIVPGSERIIIPAGAGMGEGVHFYKLNGKYFITSAWFEGRMRMPAARADRPEGPYEVNPAISIDEDFGLAEGNRLRGRTAPYEIVPPNPAPNGRMSLHQGGLVQTPAGEWWGFSMMDYNSLGRLTALSPVTWKDGWPYFGLPGNLTRTPRTWVKPAGHPTVARHAPYVRDDAFSGPKLNPVWQWSHVPVDAAWSLAQRPGHLRLQALPATSLWDARNSLTQRAMGPRSSPVAVLDGSGLKVGDVAGLSAFSRPYAWIGLERTADGLFVVQYDEQTGRTARVPAASAKVKLRIDADFLTEKARFSYAFDDGPFRPLGGEMTMVFQLTTFQGVRYVLFSFHRGEGAGGYADFDDFRVEEPNPRGLMRPIPYGRDVLLRAFDGDRGLAVVSGRLGRGAPQPIRIVERPLGRAALQLGGRLISVAADGTTRLIAGPPGEGESFQWIETPTGELVLMSLVTHRFLRLDPRGRLVADSPGPASDGRDGVRFVWAPAGAAANSGDVSGPGRRS